ncbi:hypothetical protein, partial [Limnoraphis robusta]
NVKKKNGKDKLPLQLCEELSPKWGDVMTKKIYCRGGFELMYVFPANQLNKPAPEPSDFFSGGRVYLNLSVVVKIL